MARQHCFLTAILSQSGKCIKIHSLLPQHTGIVLQVVTDMLHLEMERDSGIVHREICGFPHSGIVPQVVTDLLHLEMERETGIVHCVICGFPLPFDRFPLPFDRFPLPFDRFPLPFDRFPLPFDRFPLPFDRFPLPFDGFPLPFEAIVPLIVKVVFARNLLLILLLALKTTIHQVEMVMVPCLRGHSIVLTSNQQQMLVFGHGQV